MGVVRGMIRLGAYWLAGMVLLGCGGASVTPESRADLVMISVVGTNDSHGQLERVAVLSGYLQNLRAVREADGGGRGPAKRGRYVAGDIGVKPL